MGNNTTRGNGLLEQFLTKQRTKLANQKISKRHRLGKILDIGCGSYPFFLLNTQFNQKYGLDQVDTKAVSEDIKIIQQDIESNPKLPFDNESFEIITMLASIEHIDQYKLSLLLKEIYRTIKPDGRYIITTPASWWSNIILKIMSKFKLISSVETDEHKDTYNHRQITELLTRAGFDRHKIKVGYFEFFMNLWAVVEK